MELLCCNTITQSSSISWPTVIASLGAVATGIVAIIYSNYQSKRNLIELRLKEKREGIQRKLDEFYGPLLQLRKKSNLIYEKFKKQHFDEDPKFATLTYLLDGKKFTGNDDILLKEIIEIGKLCENLIHEKAGLIDDSHLRTEIIPRATTHFLVLRLAYQGALKGETEKFRNMTFPRELDTLLEKRQQELENQLLSL